jgi:UDP-2,3-diacylglucosamine hydrolase
VLALIAGSGALPGALIAQLPAPPLICALEGFAPDALPAGTRVDLTFRLETLGTLLADLTSRGVSRICMAGAITRPGIDPGAIDAATLPLVPVIRQALTAGDDGALRAAIAIFEQAGFAVLGAHEIAPGLLPVTGCATVAQPGAGDRADAARAAGIVAAMSVADVGQACVVMAGQALAIEGVFGTDWMLASLGARPDAGHGGLLFKAPKPNQDRRVDLPLIGPDTIGAVASAGLGGLVLQAGGVMVLEQPAVIAACDRQGIFLWVRERGT